jgi:hypothetical protein
MIRIVDDASTLLLLLTLIYDSTTTCPALKRGVSAPRHVYMKKDMI